jgi:hypothetical protein
MGTPQPVSPQKNDAWIWILVVLAVLCLCCVLIGITVGGYFLIKQKGVGLPVPLVETLLPPSSVLPTAVPGPASGPLVVEPYNPNTGQVDTLQNLVPGWQASTAPAVQTWQIRVTTSQAAAIFVGWCTSDQNHLDQNYQHLSWTVEVDGKTIPLASLYLDNSTTTQGTCRSYSGLISSWPAGQHTIRTTMHLDQEINDGWSSYPSGDYVDVYQLTATP